MIPASTAADSPDDRDEPLRIVDEATVDDHTDTNGDGSRELAEPRALAAAAETRPAADDARDPVWDSGDRLQLPGFRAGVGLGFTARQRGVRFRGYQLRPGRQSVKVNLAVRSSTTCCLSCNMRSTTGRVAFSRLRLKPSMNPCRASSI